MRIKMRTVVEYATVVDLPLWCTLWRTPYASLSGVNVRVAACPIDRQLAFALVPMK